MYESHPSMARPSRFKRGLVMGMVSCALGAQAQIVADNPDWQETEVPAPPRFDAKQLIAVDMPPFVSMEFGIDPATLTITPDGIVRYVMLAVSPSGNVTAFYEGIRCAKGEVKTYGRASASGAWTLVKNPEWRGLNDTQPSKHALALARQGACEGNTSANSVAEILRKLKAN